MGAIDLAIGNLLGSNLFNVTFLAVYDIFDGSQNLWASMSTANALALVILIEAWRYFPFAMLMILARLQAIDQMLYEAASVDGATAWAKFQHVTLPELRYVLGAIFLQRLIAHLTDEREFWPRYPVPTVALDDPKFDALQMWRGPTWVNVNYLLIEGLQRTGYVDLARELRQRTLDLINSQSDIFKYYHPQTGAAPPKAASTFGWSSAIFIDLAIQAAHDIRYARAATGSKGQA